MTLEYFDIIPLAKQSVRYTSKGIAYQPKEYKKYIELIRLKTIEQLPQNFEIIDTPIIINKLVYYFPPPKSLNKREREWLEQGYYILKATKPDITDNLNKAFFDALEGVLFTNDSHIVRLNNISKVYHLHKCGILLNFDYIQSLLWTRV